MGAVNLALPRRRKCGKHEGGAGAKVGDIRLSGVEYRWPSEARMPRILDLHLRTEAAKANKPLQTILKDRLVDVAHAVCARKDQPGRRLQVCCESWVRCSGDVCCLV